MMEGDYPTVERNKFLEYVRFYYRGPQVESANLMRAAQTLINDSVQPNIDGHG